MNTELLTPKEFAHAFRVSPRTVYNWIAEARIDYRRIGGTIRIPHVELARLMKKDEACESRAA